MFNVRLADDYLVVYLIVAGDVFDGILFCAVLFLTRCLG